MSWSCPACKRTKPEIARKTAQGILLCQLDEHHDHLRDHVEKLLKIDRDRVSEKQRVRITTARLAVMDLSERFGRTVMCCDCNQADGAAKLQIGGSLHPDFSFSPLEIATFITPMPNAAHQLDIPKARALWDSLRADVAQRLDFATMMVDRISKGLHDREPQRMPSESRHRRDADIVYDLVSRAAESRASALNMSRALLDRSCASDGKASTGKRSACRPIAVPSLSDFRTLNETKRHPGPWMRAGGNWCCPICERTKFEIVRKSNKGTWAAGIHEFSVYTEENDEDNRRRRSLRYDGAVIIAQAEVILICHDCRSILTEAKTIAPGAGDAALKPDDLRMLMGEPVPHRAHMLDQDAIRRTVTANREWEAGVEEFQRHRSEARLYRGRHAQLCHDYPKSKEAVFHNLLERWSSQLPEPLADVEGHFRWLLAEGQRYKDEDS
ncbi:hypothetical protein NUH86_22820 (plasmid) [Sphingobium sp. JS3065]|uniref:hypothetical protein n=1 Tax=Sphingobium sp. JS3065 TaxID=2970925 RepID=UPI002263D91C|nr:hypothetical protein [Sphingobium sp. JS3065]UZW57846.1 hypothetical protein NUH86_22820 [Sphingobium sp. JS3065]